MSKYVDSRSAATKAQQKHWERTGQIARIVGLINRMLSSDPDMPKYVRACLTNGLADISEALMEERCNNEFINLNITPTRRKK